MKFSNLLITAFVGSGNRDSGIHTSTSSRRCSGPLGLVAPAASVVSDLPINLAPVESITASKRQLLATTKSSQSQSPVLTGIREWLVPSAFAAETASPPTQEEIKLLREAFATFYGLDRDLVKSEKLLSSVVEAWQRQAPEEKAGIYRVRGDCYMVSCSSFTI